MRHRLIGYARVSKTDGSQSLDLQRDALRAAGVDDAVNLYHDLASGVRDDQPGLDSCLRALRKGDVLVVWKLDRLGRNLAHLVKTVQDLSARGVGSQRSCRPSLAVAFEHRLAHRAQGEACVPPAAGADAVLGPRPPPAGAVVRQAGRTGRP